MIKKEIKIDSEQLIKYWKDLEEIVVSLNQIGMASIDRDINLEEETLNYIQTEKVLERLAEARYSLSKTLEDNNININTELLNLQYWE